MPDHAGLQFELLSLRSSEDWRGQRIHDDGCKDCAEKSELRPAALWVAISL